MKIERSIACLLSVWFSGCSGLGGSERAVRPDQPPDIILLVQSGLRTGEAEQAFYQAWGAEPSLRFANAYSQSCAPFTSMGSMLGSRYPTAMTMCATRDVNSVGDSNDRPWCARVPEEVWTLPEVLELYGYASAAALPAVSPTTSTDWEAVRDDATGWWAAHAKQPRFYMIQTLDMHMLQFDPMTGYSEQKADHERRAAVASTEELMTEYLERARTAGQNLRQLVETALPPGDRPREVWLTSTNGLSLRETTGLDSDHLLAVTNTLIVDRTIHVPLARLDTTIEGAESGAHPETAPVELIDLLPTFVTMAGGVVPETAQGRDLLAAESDPAPAAYAEFGDMLAIREGDELLTFRFFLHNASSLDPRLTEGLQKQVPGFSSYYAMHHIPSDPLQVNNLVRSRTERAIVLRNRLLELRTGPGAPPVDSWTTERLQELRLNPSDGYW
ncbi:MAG: hypothetical protein CL927_00720 [Deltaproteobacteria bacterium]|nr:hypothetical protein [Deltaproteobacteria bacterium]